MTSEIKYREYRRPCSDPVLLIAGAHRVDGRALNAVTHGLRVELQGVAPGVFPRGSRLKVVIDGTTIEAEVAWSRTGQIGLRLLAPLGRRTIQRMREKAGPGVRVAVGHHGFREL